MLDMTLIASAFLLASANAGVYHGPLRAFACVSCILGMYLGFIGPMTLVGFVSLFLALGLAAHRFCALRWWRFPAFSGLAVIVAFLLTAFAMPERRRLQTLREEYPFESVEDRLPAPASTGDLPTETAARLQRSEEEMVGNYWRSRSAKLMHLHNTKVDEFVSTPGFGIGRGIRVPIRDLNEGLRPEELRVPQPNGGSAKAHDDITSALRIQDGPLNDLHRAGVLDFVNFENFGYIQDRRHVSGFQSHRFGKVPEPTEEYRVETLDLVGLLLHDKPVAYVSANLPRMDELKKVPTRPLDRFETGGLEKLRGGEDHVVADAAANLRMLGAIRSAKQCVDCHGGKRGDLLGAFSYSLVGRPR